MLVIYGVILTYCQGLDDYNLAGPRFRLHGLAVLVQVNYDWDRLGTIIALETRLVCLSRNKRYEGGLTRPIALSIG